MSDGKLAAIWVRSPRTELATSVIEVSVELIRLWSDVSKTAGPWGRETPYGRSG